MSTGADEGGRPGSRRGGVPPRGRWLLLSPALLLLGLAGFWIVSTAMATEVRPRSAVSKVRPAAKASTVPLTTQGTSSPERFTALTGLEVVRVVVSGDGGILDLRYRVVNEKLANSHKNHQAVPAIIDGVTGRALTTQWMGHAHPVNSFTPDRNYWMLFLNPDELVERGDPVEIRLGHARLTGLRIG